MGRPCSTCGHPRRFDIDKRLGVGEPHKAIARAYGLSPVSLGRHAKNCAGLAAPSELAREHTRAAIALACLPSREELGVAYGELQSRIDGIVQQAQEAGSLAVALQGLTALRQSLDSLARLGGHDRPTASVNVDVSVNIDAAVQAVLAAIGSPEPRHIAELEAIADAA